MRKINGISENNSPDFKKSVNMLASVLKVQGTVYTKSGVLIRGFVILAAEILT